MINSTVPALNRICITITAIAAANVNDPKMRKKRAITAGITRSQQGSRSCRSTEGRAKAVPATRDCASVPSSMPRE